MAAELQRFRKEYVQPVQLRYHGCPVSLGVVVSSRRGSVFFSFIYKSGEFVASLYVRKPCVSCTSALLAGPECSPLY